MPLPLREIDKKLAEFKQRGIVPKDMNVQKFSQLANEVTGSQDFKAGDIGKIGRGARRLNDFINDKVENSNLFDLAKGAAQAIPGFKDTVPFALQSADKVMGGKLSGAATFSEMGQDFGGFVGKSIGNEEIGREIGKKLPRGAANMAPALLAPFTGGSSLAMYGATGAAQGLDVYGETGSVPRAALGGATAAVMPKVMGETLKATMPFVANQIGNVGAKIASVPVSAATGFGLGIASDIGDIAMAPERSFAEMGQKEYWQAHTVGNLAFLPLDIQQAFMLKLPPRAGTPPPPLPGMPTQLLGEVPVRMGSGTSDRIDVNFRPSDEFRVTSNLVEFAQKPMEINDSRNVGVRPARRFDNMQGTRNEPEVEGDLLGDFGIQKQQVEKAQINASTKVFENSGEARREGERILSEMPDGYYEMTMPDGSVVEAIKTDNKGFIVKGKESAGFVDAAVLVPFKSQSVRLDGTEAPIQVQQPRSVKYVKSFETEAPVPISKEVSEAQAKIDSGAMDPETLIKNEPEIYAEIENKRNQDSTSSLGQKLEPDTIPFQAEQLPKIAEIVETVPTTPDEFTQQVKSVNKERTEQGKNPIDDLQMQEIVKSHVDAGDDNQTAVIKTVQTVKNEVLRLTEMQQNNFDIEQAARVEAIKAQNFSEVQTMLEVNSSHPLAKSLGDFLAKGAGGKGGPFDFRHADSQYFNDVKVAVQERLTRPLDQLKSNNVEMTRFTDELKLIKKRSKDRLATVENRKNRIVEKPYHDVEGTLKILEENQLDSLVNEKVVAKMSWLERQGGLARVDEQNELWKMVGIWARQKGYAEDLKGHIPELNAMLYKRVDFLVRARWHNAKEAGLIPIDQQYAERRQSDMLDAQHIDDTANDGYDAMILHRVIKHNNEFPNETLYDQFKDLGGTPLFGRPESNNAFVQRHPIERLAMANGYSPEQSRAHAPFVLAVTKLFETLTGTNLKIGEIIGRTNDGNMVAGLANRSAIHRAIFLNPELEPNLAGFTAAHEAIGHHMLNMHKAGLLDPEMSRSIAEVADFWTKLPQSDREDFFRYYGPELLGKDLYSKVSETLHTTAADPQESMSNLMAMLSKDSVSKFLSLERLSFLPQPVMNFVMKAMQFAKDMFRITKSWLGMRNMLGDADKEQFKKLWDFERNFSDQYKKISKENYKLTREAYKLGQLFPGGRDGEGYAGKVLAEMLDFNGNEAVNMVADAMLIPGWNQARSGMKKLSEFIEPTLNKLARYPIVQKHAGLATFVEAQLGHMIDNAQVDFLFRDPNKPKNTGGFGYMPKGGPVMEIFNDLQPNGLHHKFNELWRLQNVSKDVFLDGTNLKDPQFKSIVDGLSDTQIKTMLDANLRFRDAIKFTNGKIVESLKKELEVNVARIARKKNTSLTQDEVYRLGSELFDAYTKGRLNVAGDPYPFRAFDDLIKVNGLDGDVLTQYITKRMEGIDKIEAFYQEFPHYTPIKEYRRYQVSYTDKGSTTVQRFSTDSIDGITEFVNQSRKKGRTIHYKGQGFIDSHASYGSNRRPSQIMEQLLDSAQDQTLVQLINQMKTAGKIDDATAVDLIAGIDLWRSAIDAELEGITPGKLIPKDDSNIPREDLNFFEQNLMYMNKVSRLVPRRVTDAVFKVEKFNPEITGDPVQERMLDDLNKHIANYRMPDSPMGRSIVRGNFIHMMLANISTIALEMSQFPISLSHVMTRNGSGLFDSYRLPMKAIKSLVPYYLQGETGFNSGISLHKANGKNVDVYAQLMERGVKDKSIGFGKNQEALEQMEHTFYNLGRIAEGKSIMGSQEFAKKVWANLFTMGAKLYQIGPAFQERLSFIALFDMVHKQKFNSKKTLNESDFETIYQDVWRLSKESNQSGGRFQRPVGLFNQGTEWRTIPMMMHSLNTYNSGLMSSLYNDIRIGFFGKDIKGFSSKQKNQHKIAAFQAFSTLVAGAGVLGALPFVDSFLKLLEDKTNLNPRQAIKNGMLELGGEEMGPFLSDLATHGAAYAMGAPFDMSSRLATGGLLGINPYEGWSAKALIGPTASRIEDYLNAGGNVLKGNLTAATEKALPIGLRKGYNLLVKDGQFTNAKGQKTLHEPTFAEQSMYAIGFPPSRLAAMQEDQRIQQVNERINAERNNRFYRQMVEKISKQGYASIQQDVQQYAEENQGLAVQSIYSGIETMLTRQRLGFDPRHYGSRQGSAQRTKNLQHLQNKGLPQISSSQLAMSRIQEMMQMGQPVGDIGQTLKTSILTDMLQQNGNLSFPQAAQQAQLLTSLSYSRQNPQMQLPFLGE